MSKTFRQGATGALLDEYERAIADLKKIIEPIPSDRLPVIIDSNTEDENCISIGAVLSHVVSAGYGYAVSMYNSKSIGIRRPEKVFRLTVDEYLQDLDDLFLFTQSIFNGITDDELEQKNNSLKIKTGWGQLYDIEQLMEHAIVHMLRHRRQIEKMLTGDQA